MWIGSLVFKAAKIETMNRISKILKAIHPPKCKQRLLIVTVLAETTLTPLYGNRHTLLGWESKIARNRNHHFQITNKDSLKEVFVVFFIAIMSSSSSNNDNTVSVEPFSFRFRDNYMILRIIDVG